MKKINITILSIFLATQLFTACNSDKKSADESDSKVSADTEISSNNSSVPMNYIVNATPDSVLLGKQSEALVKVGEMKVVELVDEEGKSTGAELTVNLSITNKSSLDKKLYFTIEASNARLELDNGVSLPSSRSEGNTSPEAESTSEAIWKFTLPANTKPAKLNFFFDGTRVGVVLSKKD